MTPPIEAHVHLMDTTTLLYLIALFRQTSVPSMRFAVRRDKMRAVTSKSVLSRAILLIMATRRSPGAVPALLGRTLTMTGLLNLILSFAPFPLHPSMPYSLSHASCVDQKGACREMENGAPATAEPSQRQRRIPRHVRWQPAHLLTSKRTATRWPRTPRCWRRRARPDMGTHKRVTQDRAARGGGTLRCGPHGTRLAPGSAVSPNSCAKNPTTPRRTLAGVSQTCKQDRRHAD